MYVLRGSRGPAGPGREQQEEVKASLESVMSRCDGAGSEEEESAGTEIQ